jgi:hypothetical protein
MNKKTLVIGLIVIAAFSRLMPHPANFTGLGAIGLFAGHYLRDLRWSSVAVIGAMFVSDIVLGFHSLVPVVYGALAVSVILGHLSPNSGKKVIVASGAVVSSLSFFVITNLGVWLFQDLYPRTMAGLSSCFLAAIPFFQNQILGDLIYAAVLFGAVFLAERTGRVNLGATSALP